MNTREGAFDTKGTSITANPILVQMDDPPTVLSNYKNFTSMFDSSPPILSLLPCPPSLPCARILHQVLSGPELLPRGDLHASFQANKCPQEQFIAGL